MSAGGTNFVPSPAQLFFKKCADTTFPERKAGWEFGAQRGPWCQLQSDHCELSKLGGWAVHRLCTGCVRGVYKADSGGSDTLFGPISM